MSRRDGAWSYIGRKIFWPRTFLAVLCSLTRIAAADQSASSASATSHVGKGYEFEQNDRFAEAAEEFRAALARNPSALDVRYQLAICLFALVESDASRKEFERLRTETRNDPNVAYYLARLDLLVGAAEGAIRRLAPLVKNPPFTDASFYLGSAYLSNGEIDEAIKWLRNAAQSDPHDFRSHYRLARALQQKKLDRQAEQEYALSTELREHYNDSARQSVACMQALNTDCERDSPP